MYYYYYEFSLPEFNIIFIVTYVTF